MGDYDCIVNSVIIGVVLSYLVPRILLQFADPSEIKAPQNLEGMSMKHKLMHLMAHNAQMPMISAIIVSSIVAASLYIGYTINPMKYIK